MDALRRPDALDQSFVHELAGPFSDVGEGRGRDVEHVPTFLLQKVRVAHAVQVRQDVFLPRHLRQLPSEVLDDLSGLELDRTDLVRGHHALQDLAVQLPQEGGAVLHEDQVRDALQDDVVGERRGQRSEVALRHRDFPCLDPPEDLAGVVEVHDLVEDLVVRLLDHGEVDDLMEPVEDPLGPELLPSDGDLAALVVPEDHEGPRGAVAEALLEQLRVPDRPAEEILEVLARDELREAFQLDPLRDRDHEVVVGHAHADVCPVSLRDREGKGTAERVVHAPSEGVVEDHVPVPLHVDVAFEEDTPVRRELRDQRHLLLHVRNEGLRGAGVRAVLLLEPFLGGGLTVLRDLGREVAAEFPDRDREVEGPREHFAGPRGDGRLMAGSILHIHGGPADPDELVRAPAEDEDVARTQVLDELLAQLPERRAAFREDVVGPLLRDRPDVRVVDHPGSFLLPEAGLFLVQPDLREHLDVRIPGGQVVEHREEVLLREIVERVRSPREFERLVDAPALLEGHRHERLGEHVERIVRDLHPIDPVVVGGLRQGRAFHQVPRFEGDHAAGRGLAICMARPSDSLESLRDGLRRADLHDQVDVPNVDAELEGRRGDGGFELPLFELLFHVQAGDLRQGAMVRLQVLHAPLLEPERDVFRPASRVREDEGRAMIVDQAAEEVVHPSVRDLHRDRGDVAHGTQDRQIEGFPGVDLDDVHVAYLAVREPGEELRLLFDRGDGRAQTDPDEILPGLLP